MLARLHRVLYGLSRLGVWLCGAALLGATFLIFGEIVFRSFDRSLYVGSAEIAGYVLAVSVAWGFSFCLFERAHVRIDVAYRFAGPRLRLVGDVLSLAALLVFTFVLADRAIATVEESLLFQARSVTPLQTPLWLPQAIWAAGIVFFAINTAFLILYILVLVLRGQLSAAANVFPATEASEGLTEAHEPTREAG